MTRRPGDSDKAGLQKGDLALIAWPSAATRRRLQQRERDQIRIVLCNASIAPESTSSLLSESILEQSLPSVLMDARDRNRSIYDYAKSGRMDEAQREFNNLLSTGQEPCAFTYTAIMRGYCLAGDFESVFEWHRRMRERNITPTVYTMVTLLTTCAKTGDLHRAIGVLREYKELGIDPDIVAINSMIKVCSKSRDLDTAIRVFRQAERLKLKKTLVTYNTMMDALAELYDRSDPDGMLARAKEVMGLIEADGYSFDILTYNSLMKINIRANDLRGALIVFDKMKREGIRPDVCSYSMLIDGYAKNSRMYCSDELFQLCFELVDEMKDMGIQPNTTTYNSLLKVCVSMRDHSKAMEVFESMKRGRIKIDQITFGTLIDSYVKDSREKDRRAYIDRCFRFLMEMEARFLRPTIEIFTSLLLACSIARDSESAERVMQAMRYYGISPNRVAYTVLVDIYLRCGDLPMAKALMCKMEAEGFPPNAYAFNHFIEWYISKNDLQSAADVVAEMKAKQIEPNKATQRLISRL